MIRLLVSQSDEFPMLHDLVMANCLPHGTLNADVWRYLVLWTYGGVYADIDTQPTKVFISSNNNDNKGTAIQDSDDGWFVVEQFHILSQYVMAVSPRHPLVYYAIQHATNKIMVQEDTKQINAALVTGPHALHRAFQDFCKDAGIRMDPQGVGFKPVKAGIWQGTNGRSITVVGRGELEGEYITREMMSLHLKKKQYAKMGMSSFREDKMQSSGQSCMAALFQYHHHHHHHNHNLLDQNGMSGDSNRGG
ncbi:glycosyltransferase [Seminavis robusta]|uniref:Glycosyltransferase n=1 Tax=Seminavis robusta TaxID=568900 RepID=A0A9N8EED6_9STRA|nr:glycosyltransferase [Seminavis robusta]|eukprot:Sro1030_g233330.1 glycosyltransferase (249) ;mRNA; f:9040-9786